MVSACAVALTPQSRKRKRLPTQGRRSRIPLQHYGRSLTNGSGVPRWRANATVGWRGDRYSAQARARYLSAGVYNNQLVLTNGNIPSYVYWDLGGKARFALAGDNEVEVYADISNLFDKKSPLGAVGSPYYDVVGRYFTLGARMRF